MTRAQKSDLNCPLNKNHDPELLWEGKHKEIMRKVKMLLDNETIIFPMSDNSKHFIVDFLAHLTITPFFVFIVMCH